MEFGSLSKTDLASLLVQARADYEEFRAKGFALDMTRGKPAPEQLDLSNDLLRLPGNADWHQDDGGDTRNYYGGVQGLPEARALFSTMLGAPVDRIVVGNNSSLALMHDCLVFAMLKGVPEGAGPWRPEETKFLCPVPGYDRHFAICEEYGIGMIPVPLTGAGPDMAAVEDLVADPSVKGIWCVPKYSNPTGEIYSAETIERLAAMSAAAPDFRLFWDNAYAVHHLTDERHGIPNILDVCAKAGTANRPFVFGSTSKVTFAGGGLALFAASEDNVRWLVDRLSKRTIGPDKLNQLRHVRFFKDHDGILRHMEAQRDLITPKFAAVHEVFTKYLDGTGIADWTDPDGGYFISVDVLDGCAKRVVELAADAGIALVPAGSTFPYGRDPRDRNIRIAPTYPSLAEVASAAEGVAFCVRLAAAESLAG